LDFEWKRTFPKSEIKKDVITATPPPKIDNLITETKIEKTADLFSEELPNKKNQGEEKFASDFLSTQNVAMQKSSSEIDRIVIFYKNGTFQTYSPE